MLPRTHLLRIQRALYDRLRSHARGLLGGLSPEMKKYFQEYQRDFQDYQELSTKRELLLDILNSQIVYFGDYHTLSQAQRTVVRLLRDSVKLLKRKKRRILLALEMLQDKDRDVINRYLSGKITEEAFLKKIHFHKNWGFSWENYRELFHFARENHIEVVGISPDSKTKKYTLIERDRYAASILSDLTGADPEALIVVLIGDLHCAEKHLPKDVKTLLAKKNLDRKTIIIHQNSEKFYWKLVEQGAEQLVDVVRVKKNVYCVMNTPPWVKLQSHVKWVELLSESEERELLDPTDAVHKLEHTHEIEELIQHLGEFFEIDTKGYDDFQIKGPFDLSFLTGLSKKYSKREVKLLAYYFTHFKSLYIPEGNLLFLTSLNLNHSASLAAQYLHAKLSGFDRIFSRPRQDFYTFLWMEALGFLGSKVVNHKRKCNGPRDLKKMLKGKSKEQIKIARTVLEHLERERNYFARGKKFAGIEIPPHTTNKEEITYYFKVSKALGQIFGEALYRGVFENKITRSDLKKLFETTFTVKDRPRHEYLKWAKKLDKYDYREIEKSTKL